jgi:hypothetical protein
MQVRPLRHPDLLPNDDVRNVVAVLVDADTWERKTGEVIDEALMQLTGQPTEPLTFPLESKT